MLALATLAACSAPSAAVRVGPSATSSTTAPQQSEGVGATGGIPSDTGDRRPAPSGPTTSVDTSVTSVTSVPTTTEPVTSTTPPPAATSTVSWYGGESGAHTANGDAYDPQALTFANRTMAFGSLVRFCRGGSCVVARCTDRGPYVAGRDFDLSEGTFAQLAPLSAGVATVTWEPVG